MQTTYQTTRIQYYLDYLIEHCILAVAFFLPLSLNITSIFLTAGAVFWLSKMLVTRRLDFKRTPFDWLIALLVVLSAASILASPDRSFSFYNYYHLMGRYILLYYLVVNHVQSLDQLKRLVYVVLASSVVVSLYGFYQYYFGAAVSAVEWVDGDQFPDLKLRVCSTLQNPNLLAGFLVIVMSLAAGLGCKAKRWENKSLLFGLVVMLGLCLVITYSRGAWLSVIAVIGVYGLLYNRRIFWLLLLIPIVVWCAPDIMLERLVSIANP
ncbi:MAG TPA: O-antigen ligase family protein, partial [Negativicutes bacterium]